MWLLLNSAGPVQRDVAPHRRAHPPQCGGAPELGVGGLQILDPLGVRPEHEVGVGAHARHVVDPADHDTPVLLLLEEGRGLVDHLGAVFGKLPGLTAKTENIR